MKKILFLICFCSLGSYAQDKTMANFFLNTRYITSGARSGDIENMPLENEPSWLYTASYDRRTTFGLEVGAYFDVLKYLRLGASVGYRNHAYLSNNGLFYIGGVPTEYGTMDAELNFQSIDFNIGLGVPLMNTMAFNIVPEFYFGSSYYINTPSDYKSSLTSYTFGKIGIAFQYSVVKNDRRLISFDLCPEFMHSFGNVFNHDRDHAFYGYNMKLGITYHLYKGDPEKKRARKQGKEDKKKAKEEPTSEE